MLLHGSYATPGDFLPSGVGGQVRHIRLIVDRVELVDEICGIRVVKGEAGGDVLADGRQGAGQAGNSAAQAFHRGHAEALVVGEIDGAAALLLLNTTLPAGLLIDTCTPL